MIIPFIKNVNFFELAKLLSLQKKSILPKEYKQVEYLESSGTQYIDTGLKYRGVYYYTVDCEINDENGNEMFGMDRFDNHSVFIWDSIYRIATDRYNAMNTNISAGQRVNIIIDQSTKTISINLFSHTFTGDFFPINSVYPVLLGAYWSSWRDSIDGYGKGKIYSFKYYQSGELVRDMYPCIRKSDNKPGMYDVITNQFFTNSGTGEFITG